MKSFKFEKEIGDRWYVVLPEWTGPKEDLEMVCGADALCEILAQGENSVHVDIDREPFEGYKYKLDFVKHASGGGDYHLTSEFYDFPVWLCHVTEFVFGDLPKSIYIR